MEAACSEAPSAMDWLDDDTWLDADATWFEPSLSPSMIALMGFVMPRVIRTAIPRPETAASAAVIISTMTVCFSSVSALRAASSIRFC